jgi:hypothetical protein
MKYKVKKIFLMGGVGNQLFQLARAKQYFLDDSQSQIIKLTFGKSFIYKIINFTDHKIWIDIDLLAKEMGIPVKEASFLDIIQLALIFFKKKISKNSNFDSPYFNEEGNILHNRSNLDVGYFQNVKHVSKNAIKHVALSLIENLKLENAESKSDFSVHLRGPSFIGARKEFGITLTKKDIDLVISFSNENNLSYRVVTNDKSAINKTFGKISSQNIYMGKNAKEDFIFLCLSKNLYITNSTFAFWAAICGRELQTKKILTCESFEFNEFF